MHLAPGDLLILRWPCFDLIPTSSYLIISVEPDGSFWYYNPTEQKVFRTHWDGDGLALSVERGDIEVVEVIRAP